MICCFGSGRSRTVVRFQKEEGQLEVLKLVALVGLAGVLGELHADELVDRRNVALLRVAVSHHDVELDVEQRAARGGLQRLDLGLRESDFAVVRNIPALDGQRLVALAVERLLLLFGRVLD